MLHAVIMAGGAGTRFWPASRVANPKQLLNLAGDQSMIQATVNRLGEMVPADRLLVVTNQRLVESIGKQLPQLPPSSIIGEPCKRDTAPCIGLAAAILAAKDPNATMVVMPADHVIQREDLFRNAILFADSLVQDDPRRIVTFGIRPTYAAQTFGYIERGDEIETNTVAEIHSARDSTPGSAPVFKVLRFREKPAANVAQQYLDSGNFYWNSGIFLWKANTILAALKEYEPEMYGHIHAIAKVVGQDNFANVLACEFEAIQGTSIDYAVMERYDNVSVIEAPFDWDDVGSWRSLARLHGSDADGNTAIGRTLAIRTKNSIVRSDSEHLVATVGLENVIVVHTPDATLVVNRNDEEAVREVVALLQKQGSVELL